MTLADYSMTAFALLNGARVIAYVPQIRCLSRDNNGAAAVSLMTWMLFLSANAATVTYALAVIDDPVMAGIFLLNSIGCLIIVILIARKRMMRSLVAHNHEIPHGHARAGIRTSPHSSITRIFGILMRTWRRRAQRRLDLHLKFMLPSRRAPLRAENSE
jgi:hypothetical protein